MRSDRLAPLVVTHEVTLRRGSRHVEVKTIVENTIRDHRVRVLFPSGASAATTCLADQPFDVVERTIALRADNARYKELEVETTPHQTWTAVHDDKRGLAIIASGLPEAAVRDLPDRPIALTLLRSFQKAVFTSGSQGGQIAGTREFHYRIAPLQGPPDVAALCRAGQQLAAGTRSVAIEQFTPTNRDVNARTQPALSPSHSFLEIDAGDAVVTAIHQPDSTHTPSVRLFNPTMRSIRARIHLQTARGAAAKPGLEGNEGDSAGKARHGGIDPASQKNRNDCVHRLRAVPTSMDDLPG